MGEQSKNAQAVTDLAAKVAAGTRGKALVDFRTLAEANGLRMGPGGWIPASPGSNRKVQGWTKLAALVAAGTIRLYRALPDTAAEVPMAGVTPAADPAWVAERDAAGQMNDAEAVAYFSRLQEEPTRVASIAEAYEQALREDAGYVAKAFVTPAGARKIAEVLAAREQANVQAMAAGNERIRQHIERNRALPSAAATADALQLIGRSIRQTRCERCSTLRPIAELTHMVEHEAGSTEHRYWCADAVGGCPRVVDQAEAWRQAHEVAEAARAAAESEQVVERDGFRIGDLVQWAGSGHAAAHTWRVESITVPRDGDREPYAGLIAVDDKGPGELRTAGKLRFLRKVRPPEVALPPTFGVRVNLSPTSTFIVQNSTAEVQLPVLPGVSVQLFGVPTESLTGVPRVAAGLGYADVEQGDLHDRFVRELSACLDESWESTEGSAESIIMDYVLAISARLRALVGDAGMVRHPEDADGAVLPDAATDSHGYRMAVFGDVL